MVLTHTQTRGGEEKKKRERNQQTISSSSKNNEGQISYIGITIGKRNIEHELQVEKTIFTLDTLAK